MTRRTLTMALGLSLALNISALGTMAYCRWVAPLYHRAPTAVPGGIRAGLGLSAQQKEQIQTIHKIFLEQALPLRARTQAKNLELVKAAISSTPDPVEMARLLEESAELHRQIQSQAAGCLAREAAVLSPEQRQLLAEGIERNIRSSSCGRGTGAGMGLGVLGGPGPDRSR